MSRNRSGFRLAASAPDLPQTKPKDLQNGSSKHPTPGATFASNDKGLRRFSWLGGLVSCTPLPPVKEPFPASPILKCPKGKATAGAKRPGISLGARIFGSLSAPTAGAATRQAGSRSVRQEVFFRLELGAVSLALDDPARLPSDIPLSSSSAGQTMVKRREPLVTRGGG